MQKKTVFAVLTFLTLCLSGAAFAQAPPSGLGQSWPNTTDVSVSPSYHVFVFMLAGVRYIQVNDFNGNILGSVGTANGQYITLPIGRFSQLVSTPQQSAPTSNATPAAAPTVVYNDGATTITATPMSDGTLQLSAAASQSQCDPVDCNIKAQNTGSTTQCDPVDCNIKAQNTGSTTQCDPVDCNIKAQNTDSPTQCDPAD